MSYRPRSVICCGCGATEMHHYTGDQWRCYDCAEYLMSRIRRMADDGMTRMDIAYALGMTSQALQQWMDRAAVNAPRVRERVKRAKGIGKKPADLMPSAEALARASVWAMARV